MLFTLGMLVAFIFSMVRRKIGPSLKNLLLTPGEAIQRERKKIETALKSARAKTAIVYSAKGNSARKKTL